MSKKSMARKAARRRERLKEYKKFHNIIHNNVSKFERFPFLTADRPMRKRLIGLLSSKLKSLNYPHRHAAIPTVNT